MFAEKFIIGVNLISLSLLTVALQLEPHFSNNVIHASDDGPLHLESALPALKTNASAKRFQRDVSPQQTGNKSDEDNSFQNDEIGWSNINQEVDMVIPLVLTHLQELGIEYLQLPDMKESISVSPLIFTYEVGVTLTNGIVYNIAGLRRHEDAYMTYENKSFICKFYLMIAQLQFEYNFLLKLMALEGYGKVVGSLENTLIYAELAINVSDTRLKLNDFSIIEFRHIQVQLDQMRIIRELTGVILTPITNLFRDRITTSISDGLKEQMQMLMEDFDNKDPLELRKFTEKLLSGLLQQKQLQMSKK